MSKQKEDTVTIGIQKYLDLIKFKECIERNGVVYQYTGAYGLSEAYLALDEGVKELSSNLNKKIKAREKEINQLTHELNNLKKEQSASWVNRLIIRVVKWLKK